MPPDPADLTGFDPEDLPWFAYNWCSLPWTEWVPFNADRHTFNQIPDEPGLYRIRPAGRDILMYIGETGRPLHQRLSALRQNLRRADQMPWSDPHTEAPALWAWWLEWSPTRDEEERLNASSIVECSSDQNEDPGDPAAGGAVPVMLECSAAPLDATGSGRKAMENFLLYQYRQECGESPLCNFGRFHPRYRRSTIRKENHRGGKLADGQKDNPAGQPSCPPLEACSAPGECDWMGLEWTAAKPLVPEEIRNVEPGAGLFLLIDAGSQEILYIGESANCSGHLLDFSRKSWDGRTLHFSYQIIGQKVLPHHLKELQADLIGNFFGQIRKAPVYQFR